MGLRERYSDMGWQRRTLGFLALAASLPALANATLHRLGVADWNVPLVVVSVGLTFVLALALDLLTRRGYK